MCDPVTLILGALGAAGSFIAASQPMPTPPKAVQPALPAPTSRTPGATVRLGNSDDDITNDLAVDGKDDEFIEKRKTGNSLGNLGQSSLIL